MPDLSIHPVPFLEIIALVVAAPVMAVYGWRGVRRRRRMRSAESAADRLPRP